MRKAHLRACRINATTPYQNQDLFQFLNNSALDCWTPTLYVHIYVREEKSMNHVSYTELRANLAKYMDDVCDNRDALLVTRQNARSVVIISEEEYEGMIETLHLLRSPANAARLLRSIADADAGNLEERELIDDTPATGK
jgi:antitoxin YefM